MAQFKFTAAKFAKATDGFAAAGKEVDKALAGKAFSLWAQCAAAGILAGSITIEAVKEAVIARHKGAETLADCGNTVKGHYYRLNRCAKGGDAFLQRLANGEALVTVAADTAPVQKQDAGKRKGKGGSGKPKAGKPITLEQAIAAMNGWLDSAMKDRDLAKSLAANPDMALIIAKVGKLADIVKRGPVAKRQVTPSPRGKTPHTKVVRKKAA